MQVDYEKGIFTATCSFHDRDKPRIAGFKWDPQLKRWQTYSLMVAARLRGYMTPRAKTKLSEKDIRVSPWTWPLPPEASSLFPHQVEAAAFALGRDRSYLALDPGLGKTPTAAVISSALYEYEAGLFAGVYVTPPYLVRNIQREFATWAPHLKTTVVSSKAASKGFSGDILILPDTLLAHVWVPIVIEQFTQSLPTRLLIVDEAHRFKNETAQRTQSLYGWKRVQGIARYFNRAVSMSGTPVPNRPMELFTNLNTFAPEVIGYRSRTEFGERYCAGVLTDMGWDFSGASNLDELNRSMVAPEGVYMLRMKKDILDLPPKIVQVFLLSQDLPPSVRPLDQGVMSSLGGRDVMRERLADMHGLDTEDMSQIAVYRRVLGEYKAKDSLPFIKSILDETDEAVIVFAYHRKAIDILTKGLAAYNPFVITGETSTAKKDAIITEFRDNKARRLVIGNYLAMGVGLPMQRADRVIFVEYSWVPGENEQASDRPHRIGRTAPVLVQYITYQGSLDESVLRTNLVKMKTISNF